MDMKTIKSINKSNRSNIAIKAGVVELMYGERPAMCYRDQTRRCTSNCVMFCLSLEDNTAYVKCKSVLDNDGIPVTIGAEPITED